MMINTARGEVTLSVDGVDRKLCLTLGALAGIETALGCATIAELDVRMRALSASDLLKVLVPLLKGGGEVETAMSVEQSVIAPGEAASAIADAFRLALGT